MSNTAPERLADHEMPYHEFQVQQAQRLAELQQQAQALQAEIVKISAGRQQYLEYMQAAKGLHEGDRIEADGRIVRKVASFADVVSGIDTSLEQKRAAKGKSRP